MTAIIVVLCLLIFLQIMRLRWASIILISPFFCLFSVSLAIAKLLASSVFGMIGNSGVSDWTMQPEFFAHDMDIDGGKSGLRKGSSRHDFYDSWPLLLSHSSLFSRAHATLQHWVKS